jgi:hypothetical protein
MKHIIQQRYEMMPRLCAEIRPTGGATSTSYSNTIYSAQTLLLYFIGAILAEHALRTKAAKRDVELWCVSHWYCSQTKRLCWKQLKLEAGLGVHIVHFQLRLELDQGDRVALGAESCTIKLKIPPTIKIDPFSSVMELVLPGKNIKNWTNWGSHFQN